MLHNVMTRDVQEIIKAKGTSIFIKMFLSVMALKYKWNYEISEYYIVWHTTWFIMCNSPWKEAKFLLLLVFQENLKYPK